MAYKIGFQAGEEFSRTRVVLDPPNARVPRWLRGNLYRTGPGRFEMPLASGKGDYLCKHWFDGFTLLHHYSIESDGIYYRNQYMAEGHARHVAGYPNAPAAPVVEDCCSALFKKCQSVFVCGNEATTRPTVPSDADSQSINVTVSRMPNDTMMLKTDAAILQEFDPATLLPKAIFTYEQYGHELAGRLSAAHEQFDAATQEYFNYVLDASDDGQCTYKLFSLTGKAMTPRIITTIADDPAYLHSFAMTKNFIIFPVFPFNWDLKSLPTVGEILDALHWNQFGMNHYHVVNRATGNVFVYTTSASFCFHTINAFEDTNGDLIADLCMYTDPSMLQAVFVHPPPTHVQPRTFPLPFVQRLRFRDPTKAKTESDLVVETVSTSSRSLEMPRINPSYQMRKYRYVYGWNYFGEFGSGAQPMAEQLIKIDMETGHSLIWKDKRNMFPSEPIFIARPDAIEEDDGVVLSIVLDTTGQTPVSFMLILNAADFHEIARANLPAALPYTFHGEYFAVTD